MSNQYNLYRQNNDMGLQQGQDAGRVLIPSLAQLGVEQGVRDLRQYKTLERFEIAVEGELVRTEKKNDLAMRHLDAWGENVMGLYPCVNGRELSRDGNKVFRVNADGGRELNVGEIQARKLDGEHQIVADIDGVLVKKDISAKCYDDFVKANKEEKMALFASTFEDVKIGQTNGKDSHENLMSKGYDNAFDCPSEAEAKRWFVDGKIKGYDGRGFEQYLMSRGICIDKEKGVVTFNTGHDKDGETIPGKVDTSVKIDRKTAMAIAGGEVTGDISVIEKRINLLKEAVTDAAKDKDVRNMLSMLSFEGATKVAALSVKEGPEVIVTKDGQMDFLLVGKGREIDPRLLEAISLAGAMKERATGKTVVVESLKLEKDGVDAAGKQKYQLKGVIDGKEIAIPLTKTQAVDLMKNEDTRRMELLKNLSTEYFLDEPVYERVKKDYSLEDYINRLAGEKTLMEVQHLEEGKTKVSISFNGNVASAEISARQNEKMMAAGVQQRGKMLAQIFSKTGMDLQPMSYEEIGRMYIDKYVGKEPTALANTTAPDKYESNISSSAGVKATAAQAMAAASFSQSMGGGQSVSQEQGAGRGM